MKKIPIVFTFDDNYALPAAVAIKSLIYTGGPETEYEIYCLYNNLSDEKRSMLDNVADINWLKIDKSIFDGTPYTTDYPIDVYYRLVIHDILPQFDKVIYSDVDVLFQGDLTASFEMDISGAYWAGVPLERNELPSEDVSSMLKSKNMSCHTKFQENENEFIFASGFMVINSKKMREDNMTEKFFEIIKKFSGRLKMFDLEVLNLACQNFTIKSLPFDYCVLEDATVARDFRKISMYPFLSHVFSDEEIIRAVSRPTILHYTGVNEIRVWDRKEEVQPAAYRKFFDMVKKFLL